MTEIQMNTNHERTTENHHLVDPLIQQEHEWAMFHISFATKQTTLTMNAIFEIQQ